jgi:hypothetical protein
MNPIPNWDDCFSEFNKLSPISKIILRNTAAKNLKNAGSTAGSSDDVHSSELFSLWANAGGSWYKAILNEVEACD